jgi:hypothetical protein
MIQRHRRPTAGDDRKDHVNLSYRTTDISVPRTFLQRRPQRERKLRSVRPWAGESASPEIPCCAARDVRRSTGTNADKAEWHGTRVSKRSGVAGGHARFLFLSSSPRRTLLLPRGTRNQHRICRSPIASRVLFSYARLRCSSWRLDLILDDIQIQSKESN